MTASPTLDVGRVPASAVSGALLFARYAYPPNVLGYCGPTASGQLLEQAAGGVDDAGLRQLLRGFEGAWPYLQLIAAAAGMPDPLDARVVEAYWIGNGLLDRVGMSALGRSFEERFRPRLGPRAWAALAEGIPAGAVPHHSTHVLLVYPWVGLLREGRVAEPMRVLDGCRIRWGQAVAVDGSTAVVRTQPLVWDGHRLDLGGPRLEHAQVRAQEGALVADLARGDWCALHWDWICDRLSISQVTSLRRWTLHCLDVVNGLPHPAPAAVLA